MRLQPEETLQRPHQRPASNNDPLQECSAVCQVLLRRRHLWRHRPLDPRERHRPQLLRLRLLGLLRLSSILRSPRLHTNAIHACRIK